MGIHSIARCEIAFNAILMTFRYIFYKNAHNFGLDQYFWMKFSGCLFLIFIEKLRQLTHVVGTLSHKGIARRALPASGVKGVDGGGGE